MARTRQPLAGRDGELAVVRDTLDGARQGQSGVLVIRGEAGIGKSALLDVACGLAGDFSVSHVSGVESEMELPYAGLQQLCRPFAEGIAVLPEPLRIALEAAFGLGVGPPPDRFRVGLAVLQLLAGAAEQKPVLCVVDDAQWLDGASVQTVGFVARRMLAERMVLLIAARDASMQSELDALPELRLEGLSDLDAALVLGSVLAGPADPKVVERVLAESRGNPLALLELPRTWTDAEVVEGLADISPGVDPTGGGEVRSAARIASVGRAASADARGRGAAGAPFAAVGCGRTPRPWVGSGDGGGETLG